MSSNDHIIEVDPELNKRMALRRATDISDRQKAQRYDALVEQLKWSAAYHRERWEQAKAACSLDLSSVNSLHQLANAARNLAIEDAVMHENFNHLHVYVDPAILCPCPHCERSRQQAAAVCERTGGLL